MWIYFPISSVTSVRSNLKKLIWKFRHVKLLVIVFLRGVLTKIWGQHIIQGWLNCRKYIFVKSPLPSIRPIVALSQQIVANCPPIVSSMSVCLSARPSVPARETVGALSSNLTLGAEQKFVHISPGMLVTLLDSYSGGARFETRPGHRLFLVSIVVVLLSPLRKMPG
jgi:hypothetical protein